MPSRSPLKKIFWTGFIFSFQVALTVYVNSSFMSTKIPESLMGLLYTCAAVGMIIGMYLVPRLINRFGTKPILGNLIVLNMIALGILGFSSYTPAIIGAFIWFIMGNTLLYLGFDILIESWTDDRHQGTVRGLYLTINNLAFMGAPLLGGLITERLGFPILYVMAMVVLVPAFFLMVFVIPNIKVTHPSKNNFFDLVKKFMSRPHLRAVFIINMLLQFFYAWMVIYTPVFLHETIGIDWGTIGILFTIMLSAFVLFQYITGKIVDRIGHEKWFMVLGLAIMGIATLFVPEMYSMTFWGIALVLFVTRIGASILEVVTESYFFRHVHPDDTGSIGFFRNTYPFAYIIAPLLASLIITYAPIGTLFMILGIMCLLGTIIAARITVCHPK